MRSEYKRDMNHNYLILTGEDTINTDSYQVRMIVANVVPDLLQCRIQGIDGKFMVYYDVTSRHSMTALFENRKIGMEELQVILGGFIQVMEAMSEYLLNPCQLILEPEYIYLDAEKNNVRFCYMPGFHGEIQEQFQNLAEYLLPKLDHEDGKAVMLGYSVYRRALEDSFHLEYIKEELYKVSTGNQEDFEAYEKKQATVSVQKEVTSEKEQEELWDMENWERDSEAEAEKSKKAGKRKKKKSKEDAEKKTDIGKKAAGFAAAVLVLLGAAMGMATGYLPRVSTEIFLCGVLGIMILGMLSFWLIKRFSRKEQDLPVKISEKKNSVKKDSAYSEEKNMDTDIEEGIETEWEEKMEKTSKKHGEKQEMIREAEEGFGETMVLTSGLVKGPATLVSREPGELATIYLEQEIVVIGKLETASDAVINMPTVSRIHAKIRKRDGEYYLTDLNSRNGTSVNGQMLKAGEEHLLKDEDEVDFAQARYIFLR